MKANRLCPKVSLNKKEKNFEAHLIVLELMDIDVILGMGWLSARKGVVKYAKHSVLLTTPSGERIEYEGIRPTPEEYEDDLLESVYTENSKVECEFSDVSVKEQTPLEDLNTRDDHVYAD